MTDRDDDYLTTRVLSASPAELHLMTVEGALKHARRAAAAHEAGKPKKASAELAIARGFVTELLSGLNLDANAEIAAGVGSLFVFAMRRLAEAELKPDEPELVADAITTLEAHRDGWRELMDVLPNEPASEPAAGSPTSGPHASFAASSVPTAPAGGFSFLG